MEHNELENKLRNAAENAAESVQTNMWDRLDSRLEQKKQKKQISIYKWFSSVAAAVALLAMAYIYTTDNNSYNPDLIASAESNGLILESLQVGSNEFYDIKKLEQMTEAYSTMDLNWGRQN